MMSYIHVVARNLCRGPDSRGAEGAEIEMQKASRGGE